MNQILNEFGAFNVNGFSNLAYILSSNWAYSLIFVAAIVAIILNLKETYDTSVNEEQQIL